MTLSVCLQKPLLYFGNMNNYLTTSTSTMKLKLPKSFLVHCSQGQSGGIYDLNLCCYIMFPWSIQIRNRSRVPGTWKSC